MNDSIAWFISPHGFGHAARAAAVMEAIHELNPAVGFELFTSVPRFFFKESLGNIPFNYHELTTDIGLAQTSALEADIPETIRRLDSFLPFEKEVMDGVVGSLKEQNCGLIVCDIAPMGIAAAKAAGVRSVLVENFTWDWIYEEYERDYPAISPFIVYLKERFDSVDFHIRTEPAFHNEHRRCDMIIPPMSRKTRFNRKKTREELDIPEDMKTVVITMGGIPDRLSFLPQLTQYNDVCFVIPGSPDFKVENNVVRLPYDSDFYHPDLVNAADAVIGKPGYSTLAEVYHAGVPFGFVSRNNFRESAVMEAFIKKEMIGFAIPEKSFREGAWLRRLHELLEIPRVERPCTAAAQAARFILYAFGDPAGGQTFEKV